MPHRRDPSPLPEELYDYPSEFSDPEGVYTGEYFSWLNEDYNERSERRRRRREERRNREEEGRRFVQEMERWDREHPGTTGFNFSYSPEPPERRRHGRDRSRPSRRHGESFDADGRDPNDIVRYRSPPAGGWGLRAREHRDLGAFNLTQPEVDRQIELLSRPHYHWDATRHYERGGGREPSDLGWNRLPPQNYFESVNRDTARHERQLRSVHRSRDRGYDERVGETGAGARRPRRSTRQDGFRPDVPR